MSDSRIVVVGGSELGCRFALAARRSGFAVTLIDEHPQSTDDMSYDAPYYYGAGLPAALQDEAAVFDNVLGSNELLLECVEHDVDMRLGTVAWGVFRNSANSRHIGTPKVGLVSKEGNEMVEYDYLVLATGSRDLVLSFRGWELPGVLGVKAGTKLLESYQSFNGARILVLGTTDLAIDFVRLASGRGIEIAGLVEPTGAIQSSPDRAAWLESEGIQVFSNGVIDAARGISTVTSAVLVSTVGGGAKTEIACDTICVAIGAMPNVELPGAMGCEMVFDRDLAAWLPKVSDRLETTVESVFWLSGFNRVEGQVERILAAIQGMAAPAADRTVEAVPLDQSPAAYAMTWVRQLHALGGDEVVLCLCETVTRGEFLGLEPPKYLCGSLRHAQAPVNSGAAGPRVNLDQMKRMTRVGMGHCQGKRCRDEAAFLLANRYGLAMEEIKPASYRFPVRPLELGLIATEDDSIDTKERWPMWLHSDE